MRAGSPANQAEDGTVRVYAITGEPRALGGQSVGRTQCGRDRGTWGGTWGGSSEKIRITRTQNRVSRTELERSEVRLEKVGEREDWSSWYKV